MVKGLGVGDTELERRIQELMEFAWEWGYWDRAGVSNSNLLMLCKADSRRAATELMQYIELTYKREE